VRAVALDRGTIDAVIRHREQQAAERQEWGPAWHETGYVFTYADGRVLQPENVTRRFQAHARRAGLPVIRFHGLRHTSASLALAAGVPLKVVSDRLGHSATAITADLYSHVLPVVAHESAEAIAALVRAAPRVAGRPTSSEVLAQPPVAHQDEEEER
jgi:integrase